MTRRGSFAANIGSKFAKGSVYYRIWHAEHGREPGGELTYQISPRGFSPKCPAQSES